MVYCMLTGAGVLLTVYNMLVLVLRYYSLYIVTIE